MNHLLVNLILSVQTQIGNKETELVTFGEKLKIHIPTSSTLYEICNFLHS